MRVAHLTSDDFGGVSAVIFHLIDASRGNGKLKHEAVIADLNSERTQTLSNRLGHEMYHPVETRKLSRLRWLVRNAQNYDVLIAHKTAWYFWIGIYKLLFCWIQRPYFVAVFHDSSLWTTDLRFRERITILLIRYVCTKIIVVRESFVQMVEDKWKRTKGVYCVRNGVPQMNAVYRTLNKSPLILSLSRLDDAGKDVGTILQAVRLCGNSDLKLVVGGEGSLRSYWEKMSNKLLLQSQVKFLGEVSDVGGFFHSGDVFVLSSNFVEGGPLVVLEAMMCGTPVVASRSSLPDWVITNQLCLTFETGNAQDLADKICALCLMTPELVSDMTNRAKAYVETNFDINSQLRSYEDILMGCVAGGHGSECFSGYSRQV